MEREYDRVYDVMASIVTELGSNLQAGNAKARLASLRNSIGRDLGSTAQVWDLLFSKLPESYLSYDGLPTKQEQAILLSLQFYALHQQGKQESVNETSNSNLGESLRKLRGKKEDTKAIDRRFNAMITSSSLEEIANHIRHLVRLMSKEGITVNYAKLADDLYWYQMGYQDKVRLRWGENYYKRKIENEETK